MDSNKLGKKIRDWAINLGFRLPNGSLPPVDYFALLTATPHRRYLWEAIIESVQSRQKIGQMRKQILVAKLQNSIKISKKNYSHQITDGIDLWQKQYALETEFNDKKNTIIKLEEKIISKASDVIFEMCKLAELEKQVEELNDKLLILKLFSKRQKKSVEELERELLNINGVSNSKDKFDDQFFSNECPYIGCSSCSLLSKIENMCKSGTSEQFLWEEGIKYKKNILERFSEFLLQLNSTEKNILSEKAASIEKKLNQLVMQLKQKITLKSLQVMMNSTKGRFLELEIEKLEEKLLRNDGNLNDVIHYNSSYEMSEFYEGNGNDYNNLRSCVNVIGLKGFKEFLMEEVSQLEDEEVMRGKDSVEEEQVQLKDEFESLTDEINSYKSKEKEIGKQIIKHYHKLESLQQSFIAETEKRKTVEKIAGKLKSDYEKQIEIYLEIPMDAFRIFENSSGRILFECESESHCLVNYGGELKQFFTAILIPPFDDPQKIIFEIKNRKHILNIIKKFINDRNNIVFIEKKIQNRLSCIKYDSRLCEKNCKESDGILWNCFSKTEYLFKEIDFVENVLRNWVDQPYRGMIMELAEGRSLKDLEEQYRKGKIG